MKELFPGYYRPSEEDFAQLWKECTFAFDANVLLDLYRYKTETREELLTVLEGLAPRLWLSYQAASEYQKNRLLVIRDQAKAYADLRKTLKDSLNKLTADLNTFRKHPFVDIAEISSRLEAVHQLLEQQIDQNEKEHDARFPPLRLDQDEIRERIDNLFSGNVGAPCSSDRLAEISRLGETRYKKEIPPGFEDRSKPDDSKYGDLILWLQTVEYVKGQKKPIIFVTNDSKKDWWLTLDGKTLSPRPELAEEMFRETGQKSYIYSADQFMEYASSYLEQNVTEEAIAEVKDLQQRKWRFQTTQSLVDAQKSVAEIVTADWLGLTQEATKRVGYPFADAMSAQTLLNGQIKSAMAQSGFQEALEAIKNSRSRQLEEAIQGVREARAAQLASLINSLLVPPGYSLVQDEIDQPESSDEETAE